MASIYSLSENSSSNSTDRQQCDVNNLLYRFDPDNRWSYFRKGAPTASSVERGQRKQNQLKKVYVSKRRKVNARKNRSCKHLERMSLMCSCDKGCLISKNSHSECREFIRKLRQRFYKRSYNEQNYILSRLMDVTVSPVGRRRVTYKIPSLGTVCRGAFMKSYGFSHAKIEVLLKKMEDDGVSIQEDMRGRHSNHGLKLLPEAQETVIEFICSKKASETHYRRARTHKKYFDSHCSMRGLWKEFVAKNPDFKTNRSRFKNKGPVISFSTFRNIFNENLRDMLGFRKARVDTCQYCDETERTMKTIISEIDNGNVTRADNLKRLQRDYNAHLRESETRFASLKYDMTILCKGQWPELV